MFSARKIIFAKSSETRFPKVSRRSELSSGGKRPFKIFDFFGNVQIGCAKCTKCEIWRSEMLNFWKGLWQKLRAQTNSMVRTCIEYRAKSLLFIDVSGPIAWNADAIANKNAPQPLHWPLHHPRPALYTQKTPDQPHGGHYVRKLYQHYYILESIDFLIFCNLSIHLLSIYNDLERKFNNEKTRFFLISKYKIFFFMWWEGNISEN